MIDIEYIEEIAYGTYGDRIDLQGKAKLLNKFGRNLDVSTSYETVMEFQGSEINETYVSTNLIDSISSSAAADTSKTYTIEGQVIDGEGNLTFTVQSATTDASDGRTPVTLTTPLARVTRIYLAPSGTFNAPQTVHAGTIYVWDNTGGHTLGVPTVAAATKVVLLPGQVQSEKCATSTDQRTYWIIESLFCAIGDTVGNAALATFELVARDVKNGGVFRPVCGDFTVFAGQNGVSFHFDIPVIIPKNHDILVQAKVDANLAQCYAEIRGCLAVVVGA